MFCLKVISTCHFTLIFKFHLINCTNCKFKVRKLVKAINISVSMDNMIIMVIQFPRVTFCFAWKLFQLAISLLFSNFILLNVPSANSKYGSCWKLLMEVYQWINMIISVIQFPNVTLCFAWSYFNLPFRSYIQISYVLNFSSY